MKFVNNLPLRGRDHSKDLGVDGKMILVKVKVKVKVSLCLTKHHALNTY
jgi:hypothetical protein